jgi:hypothetical protein
MTESGRGGEPIPLTFQPDEALVLSEFLSRLLDKEKGIPLLDVVEDDGELWALDALHCLLESRIAETFRADYASLVDAARVRLSAARGGRWPWRPDPR